MTASSQSLCWLAILLLLSSCGKHYVTEYYDRNHDGIVDFELHYAPSDVKAGCASCGGFALVDTDFKGRYDLRFELLFGDTRKKIDIPVPKGVPITEKPPSIVKF